MDKEIKQTIKKIQKEAEKLVGEVKDLDLLENLRVKFLGRKSELVGILRGLKDLAEEEKKKLSPLANQAREQIFLLIQGKKNQIEQKEDREKEQLDVTYSENEKLIGHSHIVSQVQREIENIFISLGFEVADGPEIETEWYNFSALNMPADHPARDMQDTFWLKNSVDKADSHRPPTPSSGRRGSERLVARTQTSNGQIHYMQNHQPPFRVIVPGRVFRNEATDTNHEHTFNQFEALVVGEDISVANFKHIAKTFFSKFFGGEIEVRLRPSYFPFTEPSFEFDISCTVCGGKGCRSCKNSGWLEVGGCGMVNQRVFENSGYKKGQWQGFAWGFGIERLAMMKYKIDDIRLFASGDLRFIRQF